MKYARSISVALAALGLALLPSAASAQSFQPNRDYFLMTGNTLFSKAYDVRGAETRTTAPRWSSTTSRGGPNQRWRVQRVATSPFGEALYSIRPRHAIDKCLDVPGPVNTRREVPRRAGRSPRPVSTCRSSAAT